MGAAESIDMLSATVPVPEVVEDLDVETLMELRDAFDPLAEDLRIDLDRALGANQMNLIQIVALSAKLVWRVEPDTLAMVIARLICTSSDRPIPVGPDELSMDIDLDRLERDCAADLAGAHC